MKTHIVQRAVEPLIEQSPEPTGLGEPVVTLCPAREPGKLWEDFAVVEAKPRVQARTVVAQATAEIPDAELPQHFRVQDEASGRVIPVSVAAPPPPPAKRRVG